MTFPASALCLCLLILRILATCGEFTDPPQMVTIRSLADEETVLPCSYRNSSNTVVQAMWYKLHPDGTKEQIITAHHVDGQTAFGTWATRVHFKHDKPTLNSSLVIRRTKVMDEAEYVCQIITFPSGNFDRIIRLIVWTIPISSLDDVVLVEGQSYKPAATCRSVARPAPHLTWDTDLNGQSSNHSADGVVSTQFSLHPLRSMNGKKLDCLVWHPTLQGPRRLNNKLVVHFPPDAAVSGYSDLWSENLGDAALRCVSRGNPKPQFTWSRMQEGLPDGAVSHPNGTLTFARPLKKSDGGTYQCMVKNAVGTARAEVNVEVRTAGILDKLTENNNLIIIGVVAVGLLLLMLVAVLVVICHHRRKNRRLEQELTQKKEEISTLSRQASFRRMNSVSTDARGATEENIPLRVEGTLRTSLSSLGELTHCRDSRSTLSGRGGGAFDYLGRPVLHNNSRRSRERPLDREEESRIRVETYVRNSSVSLENCMLPPLMPSPFPVVQSTEIVRQINGGAIVPSDGGSRAGSVVKNHQHSPLSYNYPPVTDDEDEVDEGLGGPASQEHPDDQDSEASSSQVSEALSSHHRQMNGTFRPKPLLNPIVDSPHASLIHRAQII